MRRRNFLKKLGVSFGLGTNIGALLAGSSLIAKKSFGVDFSSIHGKSDNVFILIQLVGGNDGLNSVIPLSQYSNLYKHRENIIIKEKDIVKASDTIGFHPKLEAFRDMFLEGKLGIIQNIGYELQNRSHFRSMDIWNSGSPYNETWSSGWMGRYLDTIHSNFPNGYPNSDYVDPIAVNIGNIVADTCQGKLANYSYALDNLENTRIIDEYSNRSEEANLNFLKELDFLNSTTALANAYTKRVKIASKKGNNLAKYPENSLLGEQLKMVARLISGGLQTKVYTLTLGGFDTHAYQTTEDTSEGFHAVLLDTLSQAISAFQNDLQKLSLENRVMGMTYSEFGRQIKSNSAAGSDHGNAAPLFVFGSNIKHQVVGKNPVIEDKVKDQAALPLEFDFRDVFASLLVDWFKIDKTSVNGIFKREYSHVSFLENS